MKKLKNILITGGSGLIGTRLTALLLGMGYTVCHLGRSKKRDDIRTFLWEPARGEIERDALNDIDAIIHLAGAGIADKRWSEKTRAEIRLSRTASTLLIRKELEARRHVVQSFVSASGIGYYGLDDPPAAFEEHDAAGSDFMAVVTTAWEKEAEEISKSGVRVVKIRTGVVLSSDGGALQKLARPVKHFAGAALGTGNQIVNWIHVDDLCRIYVKSVEDLAMQGAYNAVAPHAVTNATLTREIARALKRPLWLPPVPGFVVKLIAGDVAEVVLKGGKVACAKIQQAGFHFRFPTIRAALEDLFHPQKAVTRTGG